MRGCQPRPGPRTSLRSTAWLVPRTANKNFEKKVAMDSTGCLFKLKATPATYSLDDPDDPTLFLLVSVRLAGRLYEGKTASSRAEGKAIPCRCVRFGRVGVRLSDAIAGRLLTASCEPRSEPRPL